MTQMPNWLEKRARLTPEREAVIDEYGVRWSFQKLFEAACAMAHTIQHLLPADGERVAVYAPNSFRYAACVWALHDVHVQAVLLNTRLSVTELHKQLHDADVSLLIFDETLALAGKELTTLNEISSVCLQGLPLEMEQPEPVRSQWHLRDEVTMMFTSGTTGRAKGVRHTLGNHYYSASGSVLNLGLHNDDRWLLMLPMFHVGGMSILYRGVLYGMPVHLLPRFDAEKAVEIVYEEKITIMSAVAVMLDRMLDYVTEGYELASIRSVVLGGGPASKTLLERAAHLQVPVQQTYGMTETAAQFCTQDTASKDTKAGTAGKPLFFSELKIVKDGQQAKPFEVGELVLFGPQITPGYFRRPEANEKAFSADGWFYTGDLGWIDEDGDVYIADRRSDMIISGGENIYPAEVEGVLEAHPAVLEAGVAAQADEVYGEVPAAFIVVREAVSEEVVKSFCKEKLAGYKVPKTVIYCEELPRTAARKLKRHVLKERLQKGGQS
ncbi:2-succinylbenzoyl-CoA synthetase [Salsuginibacillus halophilus]|uniref:2-succinylbenzoate--CoA ligase n=2 Tax=Salsuginibacillus halophilus TaxID=517424 RepID=A0A2P8HWB0_9BACI|nr:2-succinylbenzoyl-CoA synthetase [Salsuginibacillus halophilus]